jgi:hypothetical protein
MVAHAPRTTAARDAGKKVARAAQQTAAARAAQQTATARAALYTAAAQASLGFTSVMTKRGTRSRENRDDRANLYCGWGLDATRRSLDPGGRLAGNPPNEAVFD